MAGNTGEWRPSDELPDPFGDVEDVLGAVAMVTAMITTAQGLGVSVAAREELDRAIRLARHAQQVVKDSRGYPRQLRMM